MCAFQADHCIKATVVTYANVTYQILDAVAEFFTVQRSRAIHIKYLKYVFVTLLNFHFSSRGGRASMREGWITP
jgi:hypothetical protein